MVLVTDPDPISLRVLERVVDQHVKSNLIMECILDPTHTFRMLGSVAWGSVGKSMSWVRYSSIVNPDMEPDLIFLIHRVWADSMFDSATKRFHSHIILLIIYLLYIYNQARVHT